MDADGSADGPLMFMPESLAAESRQGGIATSFRFTPPP